MSKPSVDVCTSETIFMEEKGVHILSWPSLFSTGKRENASTYAYVVTISRFRGEESTPLS